MQAFRSTRSDHSPNAAATPCPLCGGVRSRSFPIYYDFNHTRFSGNQCHSCGFVFLAPRPTTQDLELMYGEDYFTGSDADHGAHSATDYETAALLGSVKFPEILGWIQRYKRSGTFFEIGCGMGFFLDFARGQGFTVSGIEYSAFATQKARERFHLNVQVGSPDTMTIVPDAYDVVFLGDVLEHMVHPLQELERIRGMIRSGGIVAVEVPSQFNAIVGRLAISLYRMTGKRRFMRLPPYHVNEFTPKTIRKMLERAGFVEVRVIERVKPPDRITLRGSLLDRMAKKSLQYPNYWITRSLGMLGDRILAIGVKRD
jgi:SAM-dependent methyltransferase